MRRIYSCKLFNRLQTCHSSCARSIENCQHFLPFTSNLKFFFSSIKRQLYGTSDFLWLLSAAVTSEARSCKRAKLFSVALPTTFYDTCRKLTPNASATAFSNYIFSLRQTFSVFTVTERVEVRCSEKTPKLLHCEIFH